MVTLPMRIRRARNLAGVTQSQLALRLNLRRSAVSQWESALGTTPSVSHLIGIAMETGVSFEWLATGRGSARLADDAQEATVMIGEFAQDELESRGLVALRQLTRQRKRMAVAIVELLGGVGRASPLNGA